MVENAAHKKRFTERYDQMLLSKPFLQESLGILLCVLECRVILGASDCMTVK